MYTTSNHKKQAQAYTKAISYRTLVGLFFLANFIACSNCSNNRGKSGEDNSGETAANTSNTGSGGTSNGGGGNSGGTPPPPPTNTSTTITDEMLKAFKNTEASLIKRIQAYQNDTNKDINEVEKGTTLLYAIVLRTYLSTGTNLPPEIQQARENLVDVLLNRGAKPDQPVSGQTALWILAKYGPAVLVKKCLGMSGIKTNIKFNNQTPYQVANQRKDSDPEKAAVLKAFTDAGIST